MYKNFVEALVELKLAAETCPEIPILFGNEFRSTQIKCRHSEECAIDQPCCFNGIGTSCLLRFKKNTFKNENILPIKPQIINNVILSTKIGLCTSETNFNTRKISGGFF